MWLLKEMMNKHVQIPENDVMDFIIHTKINMLRMLLPFKKSVWGWSLGKNYLPYLLGGDGPPTPKIIKNIILRYWYIHDFKLAKADGVKIINLN